MTIRSNRIFFKNIIILFLAIIMTAVNVSAESGSWGLSFSNNGGAPKGNEQAEYLKKFDAYFIGNGDEKEIFLTFDSGYENGCTESILNTLKDYEVPAAFFLVGTYIRDNPDLVKRMVNEGHIVANHTMTHPNMSAITDKTAFEKELSQTEDLYKSVIGLEMPKFYRPPRGIYSEANMQMAKELGYKTIFWSLAYVDWKDDAQPTKEAAFAKLLPRIHPGAVLLLHSNSKTNAAILGELITKYREMGYEFKSLDYLVA